MKKRIYLSIIVVMTLTSSMFSQSFTANNLIEFWVDIGEVIYIENDFNQDGELEFLVDANNKTQIIIGEIKNNRVKANYKSQLFSQIEIAKYFDVDGDDISELFVIDTEKDSIYQLSPSTLVTIKSAKLDLPNFFNPSDLDYAALEKGGEKSMILTSLYYGAYKISPIDFSTIEQLTDALEAQFLMIGNFDNDSENEICLVKSSSLIQILNIETYAVEYEISDSREDYQIIDINDDGVFEIVILDTDDDLLLFDFSKATPQSIVTDLPYGYTNVFVRDIDSDLIPEIVLYDIDDDANDLIIINTSPLSVDKIIDLPFRSQNYSGKILGLDRFVNPSSESLLFSSNNLSSVNYNTGSLEKSTFSMSNIALTNFGFFTGTDEKQMVISEIEASTGEGALSTSILGYETQNLEHTIYPSLIDPEKPHSPDMLGDIRSFKFPGDATSDLILKKSYLSEVSFYSPVTQLVYNRDKFKLRDFIIDDISLDGKPELIQFEPFDDEIIFYNYIDKNNWEQRLKVLAGNDLVAFFDIDNDLQKELIAIDDNTLKIINVENGLVTELSTDFSLWQVDDFTFYRTHNDVPMFAFIGDSKIIIYNIETQSVEIEKSVSGFYSSSISAIQMVANGTVNTYFITDFNGLEIYDQALDLVLKLPEYKQSWPNISKVQIHNDDGDKKPNLLVSYKYQVVDYNLELPGDYRADFFVVNHYPQKNDIVNEGSTFFIQFNKSLSTEVLLSNLSLINEADQSELPFQITTKDNYKFEIHPESQMTLGTSLKLSLSDKLKSRENLILSSKQLENGNYTIPFQVTENQNTPTISLSSENFNTLYNRSKRLIQFEGNIDSNDAPLRSVRAGYSGEEMDIVVAKDGVFDSRTEKFEVLINGFNRSLGSNELMIILDAYNGNSDTMTLNIDIVAEKGIPYKRNGINNLNTFYQKRDSAIGNKYGFVWSNNIVHDDVFDGNTVFGEGDYIYLRKSIKESNDPILYLHKIDKNTGTIIYKIEIGFDASSGNFVLDNGQIYLFKNEFGSKPELLCIDADTGDIIWETEFRNQHSEEYSPLVTDSYVLMSGGQYGGIYCFDRWTGQELWFNDLDYVCSWSPSFYNGIVYTSAAGEVKAFDVENGNLIWEVDFMDCPSFSNSSPIIDTLNNQLIYYTGEEIHALSLDDHSTNWVNPFNGFFGIVAFSENFVYAKNQNTLYKIDALSGTNALTKVTPNSVNEMFIASDLIFLNGNNGTFVYDRNTLENKGSFEEQSWAMSLVDDMLFFSGVSELKAYRILDQCYDFPEYNEFICFGENFVLDELVFEEAGTYMDTLVSNSGCDKIFTLNLTVSSQVSISDTLISSDNGGGDGSIAVFPIGGGGLYTYDWENGETTQLISDLNAGIYKLTITDENGCLFNFEFKVPLSTNTIGVSSEISIYPTILQSGETIVVNNLPAGWHSEIGFYHISSGLIQKIQCTENRIALPQNLSAGQYFIEFKSWDNSLSQIKRIVLF